MGLNEVHGSNIEIIADRDVCKLSALNLYVRAKSLKHRLLHV
jgi:hypothetical protein